MLDTKRISELTYKHVFGFLTPEEKEELEAWLESLTEEERKMYYARTKEEHVVEELRMAYSTDESFEKNKSRMQFHTNPLGKERRMFRFGRWGWVAAAGLLVAVSTLGYKWMAQRTLNPGQSLAANSVKDVPPGSDKAILTLDDGSQVLLDAAPKGVISMQGVVQVVKLDSGRIAYKSAAGDVVYGTNKVATPPGGKFRITLPDGTDVWLNAASSISYPTVFQGAERRVKLAGEGYFEVKKDPSKPFFVEAGGTEVKVLGTHFNVMAYGEEPSVNTTLVEGSVQVSASGKSVKIVPGQQAQFAKGKLQVEQADTASAVAWTTGYFGFSNAELHTVMNSISRWYNVQVKYNTAANDSRIDAIVNKNVPLSVMLSALETASQYTFRVEGSTITVLPK